MKHIQNDTKPIRIILRSYPNYIQTYRSHAEILFQKISKQVKLIWQLIKRKVRLIKKQVTSYQNHVKAIKMIQNTCQNQLKNDQNPIEE